MKIHLIERPTANKVSHFKQGDIITPIEPVPCVAAFPYMVTSNQKFPLINLTTGSLYREEECYGTFVHAEIDIVND